MIAVAARPRKRRRIFFSSFLRSSGIVARLTISAGVPPCASPMTATLPSSLALSQLFDRFRQSSIQLGGLS